jgi:7-keto-8-aminopelargonate synthetase-like enzyme
MGFLSCMMTAITDDLIYQYKDERETLTEVWIAENYQNFSSNDFLNLSKAC